MAANTSGSRGSWVHQPPDYFRDMFSVLMQQRLKEQYCDAQVVIRGQQFPAHKAVLAANSNFFNQYFTSNKDSNKVELHNVSVESFVSIIDFMYSGRLLLQEDNVTDVLQTASLLQMHNIVTVCCNFVKEKLQANRVEHSPQEDTPGQRTDGQCRSNLDPPQLVQISEHRGTGEVMSTSTHSTRCEEASPASLVGALRRKCTVVPRRASSPGNAHNYRLDGGGVVSMSRYDSGRSQANDVHHADSMDVVIRVKTEDTSGDQCLEAGAVSSSQETPVLMSQSSDGSEREFSAPLNQGATPLAMSEQRMDTGHHDETSPSSASWESPLHSDSSSEVHPVAVTLPTSRQEGSHDNQAWSSRLLQPGGPDVGGLLNTDVQCPFCYEKFSAVFDLWRHVKTHRGDNPPHLCKICGATSPTQKDLDIHIQYNHPGQKMYQCCFCPTKFCHKRNIMQHLRMHMQQKEFACSVCNARFFYENHLVNHMRTHTGEKPFQCPECGARFALKGNLKAHLRIHTGERPFGCEVCGHRFTRMFTLKKHMQRHTRFFNMENTMATTSNPAN